MLNVETFKYLGLSVLLHLGSEMDRFLDNMAMIPRHTTLARVSFARPRYKPHRGHYMLSVILQQNIQSHHSRNKYDCYWSPRNGIRPLQTPALKNSCSYERWCRHPLDI